ncbi:MAG: putative ABC exporter domain-containing protein [Gemmatimonadaceae bacterium]
MTRHAEAAMLRNETADAPQPARRPAPARALLFLHSRTLVNRLRAQAARVRSPRYISAVLLGVLYIWWALFRNTRTDGAPLTALLQSPVALLLASTLLLASSARWWLFGSDRSALAFSPPEVAFLFPAPITRRGLVHAKLLRLQVAILVNTLIFTVIFRGNAASLASWERALGLWMLFSTLALHRLGSSIVRASALEHGRAGQRRSLLPLAVFGTLIGAVGYGLFAALPALVQASVGGVRDTLTAVATALQSPVPSAALWPVRALLAPVFGAGSAAWGASARWAALILLVHDVWVVRLDRAFEESAIEATQHRAERLQRFRASQMGQARSRTGKLARVPALSLTGRPEVAIAWKNVVAALRGGAWRTQLIAFIVGLSVLAFAARSASENAADAFLGVTMGWGAMLLFVGPLWMRFDLRLDLPRLAMLKTMPLDGWRIVTAEIAAVTLLHSITVWSLMTVPLAMVLQDPQLLVESGGTIPMVVAVAVGVPAFNALMFTIHNGTALLFPAWVRLGTEARGFETMGQNLLTTGATTLVAAVALVFPVGAAALALWLTNDWGGWSVLLATILASGIVLLELWPVLRWLGTVFEQTDVNEVAAAP